MKVTLLQHTPEPELTIALAARLCYSSCSCEELQQRLVSSDITGFIDKIMALGHQSVLEHASFTFGVDGISRVTSHQLVRHRVASFSQQSQRYVPFTSIPVVIPENIKQNKRLLAMFQKTVSDIETFYAIAVKEGIPAEDARYLVPNATETKILITMNARELLHFFAVRCCERAQWEIRAMAIEMLKLVSPLAPTVFKDAGPGCLVGACPEAGMTCGNASEVRKKFRLYLLTEEL